MMEPQRKFVPVTIKQLVGDGGVEALPSFFDSTVIHCGHQQCLDSGIEAVTKSLEQTIRENQYQPLSRVLISVQPWFGFIHITGRAIVSGMN